MRGDWEKGHVCGPVSYLKHNCCHPLFVKAVEKDCGFINPGEQYAASQ